MTSLWPLFLISGAAVGFEIALTRYFAVAKWSEYGYWVISIVMVGFALSGVVVAVARASLVRRGEWLLRWLPVALIAAAAGGYWAVTVNPFNPLQLQNAVTYGPQLLNIALYYAELLPFFFLAGLYISLSFVLNGARVARVYGFDLTGAGAGAALVLLLMGVVHPFQLVPALLPLLAASCLFGRRAVVLGLTLLVLGGSEALLLAYPQADYNDFKAIYAPSHTPGAKQVAEVRSPRGLYALLDDFTERVDVDISNDAGMLNVPGPPASYGLYRDGARIAALPKAGGTGVAYAPAALSALPYELLHQPKVLLLGASGGFGVQQALALGASSVAALEPDPVLLGAVRDGLGPAAPAARDKRAQTLGGSPLAIAGSYDLIEIAGDFLDAGEANGEAYTAEGLAKDLQALRPGGLLSVPVSIREFPVYAVRVLATVRQALLAIGAADPAANVVVYRSAWNLRVLAGREPWTEDRIATLRKWCDDRSFDVSYYPGIDVAAARANIYNDLPAVDFQSGEVDASSGSQDAVADEAGAVLRGETTPSQLAFDLRPITLDRPFYYDILRMQRLPDILRRVDILPQQEVGQLVNLAVLAQAALIAVLVLLVPVFAPGIAGRRTAPVLRSVVYFAGLGLGFLFIEIFLIEKASLYLADRTSAFATVLTGMLVFSGLGSLLTDRVRHGGIALAAVVIVGWCLLAIAGLEPLLLATIGLPWAVRVLILLMVVAPASVALGLPFPLGLAQAGAAGGGLLPWAWALNGAFSVVATPLANFLAIQFGFDRLLLVAAALYVIVFLAYPRLRKSVQWQPSPTL